VKKPTAPPLPAGLFFVRDTSEVHAAHAFVVPAEALSPWLSLAGIAGRLGRTAELSRCGNGSRSKTSVVNFPPCFLKCRIAAQWKISLDKTGKDRHY